MRPLQDEGNGRVSSFLPSFHPLLSQRGDNTTSFTSAMNDPNDVANGRSEHGHSQGRHMEPLQSQPPLPPPSRNTNILEKKKHTKHRKRQAPPGPAGVWFQAQRHSKQQQQQQQQQQLQQLHPQDVPDLSANNTNRETEADESTTVEDVSSCPAWMSMQRALGFSTPYLSAYSSIQDRYQKLRPLVPPFYTLLSEIHAGQHDLKVRQGRRHQQHAIDNASQPQPREQNNDNSLLVLVHAVHCNGLLDWTVDLRDECGAKIKAWLNPKLVQVESKENFPNVRLGVVWQLRDVSISIMADHTSNNESSSASSSKVVERILLISRSSICRIWTPEQAKTNVSDQEFLEWMARRSRMLDENNASDNDSDNDGDDNEYENENHNNSGRTKNRSRNSGSNGNHSKDNQEQEARIIGVNTPDTNKNVEADTAVLVEEDIETTVGQQRRQPTSTWMEASESSSQQQIEGAANINASDSLFGSVKITTLHPVGTVALRKRADAASLQILPSRDHKKVLVTRPGVREQARANGIVNAITHFPPEHVTTVTTRTTTTNTGDSSVRASSAPSCHTPAQQLQQYQPPNASSAAITIASKKLGAVANGLIKPLKDSGRVLSSFAPTFHLAMSQTQQEQQPPASMSNTNADITTTHTTSAGEKGPLSDAIHVPPVPRGISTSTSNIVTESSITNRFGAFSAPGRQQQQQVGASPKRNRDVALTTATSNNHRRINHDSSTSREEDPTTDARDNASQQTGKRKIPKRKDIKTRHKEKLSPKKKSSTSQRGGSPLKVVQQSNTCGSSKLWNMQDDDHMMGLLLLEDEEDKEETETDKHDATMTYDIVDYESNDNVKQAFIKSPLLSLPAFHAGVDTASALSSSTPTVAHSSVAIFQAGSYDGIDVDGLFDEDDDED